MFFLKEEIEYYVDPKQNKTKQNKKSQRRKRKLHTRTSLPSNLRPVVVRPVQSRARGCERASQGALRFPLTPANRPKNQAQIATSPSVPSPSPAPRSPLAARLPAAIEAAPITEGGPLLSPPSPIHGASAPSLPRTQVGSRRAAMDLDLWISKVKEGQHLAEHELQSLCEYVSFLPSCSLVPRLGFFSPRCSLGRLHARSQRRPGVLGFLAGGGRCGEKVAFAEYTGCVCVIDIGFAGCPGEGDPHRRVQRAAGEQPRDGVW